MILGGTEEPLFDSWIDPGVQITEFWGIDRNNFQHKSVLSLESAQTAVQKLISGKIVVGYKLWDDFAGVFLSQPFCTMSHSGFRPSLHLTDPTQFLGLHIL